MLCVANLEFDCYQAQAQLKFELPTYLHLGIKNIFDVHICLTILLCKILMKTHIILYININLRLVYYW